MHLAIEEKLPDLRSAIGLRIIAVAAFAHPDALFVQLDALVDRRSEERRAEAAIANWNRIGPLCGRLLEEDAIVRGFGSAALAVRFADHALRCVRNVPAIAASRRKRRRL